MGKRYSSKTKNFQVKSIKEYAKIVRINEEVIKLGSNNINYIGDNICEVY